MNSINSTREERRKENELNEARKAGKIEALKDEEGNDINPHMPQYIIKAPWYLNQTKPGLKHQRYRGTDKVKIEEERNKKIFLKKGKGQEFCKNCGSITHQEKFCLERTRKRKVNFMKKTEDEKEFIYVNQDLGFDGNRDRWVGYNADNFKYVVEEYEKIVEEKKKRKAEELKKKYEKKSIKKKKKDESNESNETNETNETVKENGNGESDDDIDSDTDGNRNTNDGSEKENKIKKKKDKKEKKKKEKENENDKEEEEDVEEDDDEDDDNESEKTEEEDDDDDDDDDTDNKEQTVGAVESANINAVNKNEKNRTITRNLRIREDTAKYLYNLSLNSAFYDPKSRSMREDPFANIPKNINDDENNILQDSTYYKGENYYNNTGDAIESKKLEVFAWHTYKRGENVHFNAQPTQLELLYKEFLEKKKKLITKKQENILKTYNCENVTKDINVEEELEQSEIYKEYKPIDQVRESSLEKKKIQVLSKYEEDVYSLGHTSVYGSYYDRDENKWGYKCCKVMNKFEKCPLI